MKKSLINFIYIAFACSVLMSCGGEKTHYVTIETDYGIMKAELYNSTPLHRDNFLKLVKENFYDDLLFHRIINGFMIQGGDPQSRDAAPGQRLGMGGPGYLIDAEIGAPHFKGTLAAARTGGASNPEKKSSGSQFYVVHGTPQSDASLERFEAQKGIQYNESQKEKYKTIGGTPMLDQDYTVFGELVSGMDVLDKIAAVQKDGSDRPLEDVKMKIKLSSK
jgi:peptidyl-prolyl cis-trans isomerase B (cyclophilin B)